MTPTNLLGPRVLELARDPLFASVDPSRCDWVPTGRRLEPAGRAGRDSAAPTGLARSVLRALRGEYDLIIFPAVRLSTPGDRNNRKKRWIRRTLIGVSRFPLVSGLVSALFRLDRTPHVIRDVGDFPEIEEISTALFRGARFYLKREVLEDDLGRTLDGGARVMYTPMPFNLSSYPDPSPKKTADVFYAARDYGAYRRQAKETLARLSSDGIVVDMPTGRVDFEEYLKRLAAARLVVSPRGQGEHCYRHYEALLMGAVPVISKPDRPIHYDLLHGESALFYDPAGDGLRETIMTALEDPGRLRTIAENGARLVRARHSKAAICRQLVASLTKVAAR